MFGLRHRGQLNPTVADEFTRLQQAVSSYLLTEHAEDGSHNMEPVGLGFVRIGAIVLWPMPTAPTGWQLCNGADVNRVKYLQLYTLIGVTHGAGDGSTTFTLPNIADVGLNVYIIFTGLGN